MPQETQNYNNHARYHPPFHFVLSPLLLIILIWTIVALVMDPGWSELRWLLVTITLIVIGFLTRTNALKAQDRVIRLEERLRYQQILSPDLLQRATALTEAQMIALRFASDEDLPELIKQTLDGKFASGKEIKQAITTWRGDYFRV